MGAFFCRPHNRPGRLTRPAAGIMLSLLFVILLNPTAAANESPPRVTLTASPAQAHPGDLIELRATVQSTHYTSVSLTLPPQPELHLVATQKLPTSRSPDGTYQTSKLWIIQALRSGPITLTGLRAELSGGKNKPPIPAPSLTLQITPYSDAVPDDTPALWLPDTTASPPQRIAWILLILVAAVALTIVATRRLRGVHSRATPFEDEDDALSTFIAAARQGSAGRPETQQFLLTHGEGVPEQVRRSLERAAYAPAFDSDSLAAELAPFLDS